MGVVHDDILVDTDAKCIINIETRKIINETKKNVLVQYDHNSERVGFIMPRYIDSHDMYKTSRITVNYVNGKSTGSYIVEDVSIVGDDRNNIIFSWLISGNATQNSGLLVFNVNFRCIDSDGNITYNWSTMPCSLFTISEGFDYSGNVDPTQVSDIIARFEREFESFDEKVKSYEYVQAIEDLRAEIQESSYGPITDTLHFKLGTIMSTDGQWDSGDTPWQYSCIDYLDTNVKITVNTGYYLKLICYDANKVIIDSVKWGISEINKQVIMNVSEDTKYIRFCVREGSTEEAFEFKEAGLVAYGNLLNVLLGYHTDKGIKQEFIGGYYISGVDGEKGNLVESTYWSTYVAKVLPNTEYEVVTNTGTAITDSNKPKMLCAVYSTKPLVSLNMSEYLVNETEAIAQAQANEAHRYVITTASNAEYMVIASDSAVHKVINLSDDSNVEESSGEMEDLGIVNIDTIRSKGEYVNGAIKITQSFSLEIPKPKYNTGLPIVFYDNAYYTGEAPAVQYYFSGFYESMRYAIGSSKGYELKERRIPPFMTEGSLIVTVLIPEGTELYIKDFGNYYDRATNKNTGVGPRFDAHLGFYGLCPNNTMIAFEMAEKCGYPSCIVVPKVTKDGVLVCIHDDTINATARDQNGNKPTSNLEVSNLTYKELLEWDFGLYKHSYFKGTKIPLLSDFFDLCAKTGMKPMFSTHPALTSSQWTEVRMMLLKRGLLSSFTIKSFDIDILKTAFSIFGNNIEGYIYDVSGTDYKTYITQMDNLNIKVNKGIEYQASSIAQEICDRTINAGYFVSAWNIGRIDSPVYEKLIEMGVTRFTDDYNCSYGLNW